MLTLFTWGYWGWGNATRELIRAVDARERRRGFKPPIFFDIRASRSVRAVGFRGSAFELALPKGRYHWFPRLGNERIASHESGIKIADPFAAKILLEKALNYAKDNRRVIFFCACEFPRWCHRHIVARLVLQEAIRIRRRVRIVEWPGEAATHRVVTAEESLCDAVFGGAKNVPLNDLKLSEDYVCLPWGSSVNIESNGRSAQIITGPARFRGGWSLPVHDLCEPNRKKLSLGGLAEEFRKRYGLEPLESRVPGRRTTGELKVLTIRQPWAHAIVHLGKDVENRSWRTKYKGRLLIHAAAHQEGDPFGLLTEHMGRPPRRAGLDRLPTGSIIGVVDLFDYVRDSGSKWASKGAWHWLLRDVRPIKPIPCGGQLGLWTAPASLMRKIPKWVRNLKN